MPDASVAKLIADVDALVACLDSVGERGWSQHFRRARVDLANGDSYGLERILAAYGGMGSFNDLVICPHSGHTFDSDQISAVNEKIHALGGRIRSQATELRR